MHHLSPTPTGKPGCGKTALAAQLAQECSFPFVKIVTPENMIGYNENGKCQAIKMVVYSFVYRIKLCYHVYHIVCLLYCVIVYRSYFGY